MKDDGLAAGKGVVVTTDRAEALAHAATCERVVIEEFLDGPEVSLFALCDGTTVVPLVPAQDFKRVGDGDAGPEHRRDGRLLAAAVGTGRAWSTRCSRDVLQPTVDEMARRGTPFAGLLYAGLALTSRGRAGDRVQRPVRRPGDPGGAGPAAHPARPGCCGPPPPGGCAEVPAAGLVARTRR